MRLTLRTMLAYLDEILEPADAQEVGKKIDESEFATSLMHRTRDVTRRMRLAAPKLEGRGMGLDPNTVAEYLDNTLPAERVADFEKVCLESDVHLAEVASAHQILALVLGEPAEVDPQSRQRMYGLAAAAEKAAATAANGADVPRRKRAQPQVPDYLREPAMGRGRRVVVAAGVVLLLGLGLAAVFATPQLRQRWFGQVAQEDQDDNGARPARLRKNRSAADRERKATGSREIDQGEAGPTSSDPDTSDPDSDISGIDADDTGSDTSGDSGASGTGAGDDRGAGDGRGSAIDDPSSDVTGSDRTDGERSSDDMPDDPAAGDSPLDQGAGAARSAASLDGDSLPADLSAPDAAAPDDSDDDSSSLPPIPGDDDPLDPALDPALDPGAPADTAGQTAASPGIGRLISEQDVLLRLDRDSGAWVRLPPRETLHGGDRLLALPTFRPNVVLAVGVTMQMIDDASVVLEAPDQQGVPGIDIAQGRVVLFVARPGAQLRLTVGDRQWMVAFAQDDATIALDVTRHLVDGQDPETSPAEAIAHMYVSRGQIQWQESGGQPQSLDAPARRVLIGPPDLAPQQAEPAAAAKAAAPADGEAPQAQMPGWIASAQLDLNEQRASGVVEQWIRSNRATSLALKELAAHRRVEVCRLAALCLVSIREFDAVLPMLTDSNQKSAWPELIASLRSAMASGPEDAALVRQAFQQQRGADGADLYRMLWAYTPAQLAGGEARRLIKFLDHEDLDYRVLSIWALQRATGQSHFYRPEHTADRRQTAVKRWQGKLEEGFFAPKPARQPAAS